MNDKLFTQEDYDQINADFASLMESAQRRCRFEKETKIIQKAFEFANEAHKNVRRRSGEPYMLHPIAVAKIVVNDIGLGYKSIVAALLHDVVEDTDYTVDDIRSLFGDKIASLVEGLTKIKIVLDNQNRQGSLQTSESIQAENLKRILLTLNDDVRVVLIKLADRLHNCRTIEYMPEHKRDKILSETMFIFIPLAHRLGLYGVKSEMENIWLKYKEPDAYEDITRRINENVAERQKDIDEFISPIFGALRRDDFNFTIKQRIKTPYSIWNKMMTKNVPFEQIYDLYAVRIIFDPATDNPEIERKQAYMIYADVIGLYKEKPGRHRDWIETPKSNGYEALHSTLMSRAGFWVEVQIRSKRMDDIAEKGIAAHWAYKRGGYASENDSKMDKWLAKVQEILVSEDVNALELLDIVHSDLVSTDIVVFTPKGDQKTIQKGATALDLAYAIHTEIGAKAIAAKINMRLEPLSQILKAGDQVEIITSNTAHPHREWLTFLKTRKAKSMVMDYFRSNRKEFITEGKKLFRSMLESAGIAADTDALKKFMEFNRIRESDELYFQIGIGLISQELFHRQLSTSSLSGEDITKMITNTRNEDGYKYILSDCCKPIPGDPIVGFKAQGGIVLVHKKSCKNAEWLGSTHGTDTLALQWVMQDRDFQVRISLHGIDRTGLLHEITHFISLTMGVNMRNLQLGTDGGIFEGYIDMLVKDKNSLDNMLDGLRKIEGIQDVVRMDI